MKRLLIFFLTLLNYYGVNAQMPWTRIVRDSLATPWELIYGPDDHIWFTQKNGYICRMEPNSGHIDTLYHQPDVFCYIDQQNAFFPVEAGMLGMALHPDFPNTPYVYAAYVWPNQPAAPLYNLYLNVLRYTNSGGILTAPVTILDSVKTMVFHTGCRLLAVSDKLFITLGDAGNDTAAQNLSRTNGKILRINLDGTIPSDNPVPGSPVWSWGHRNPQGLVMIDSTLWSSEHGPDHDDELNIIEKGRNYGWPFVEGFCDQPAEAIFCADSNVKEPVFDWHYTLAVCGLDYYHHPMFPGINNNILMATLKDSKLHTLKLNAAKDSVIIDTYLPGVDYGRLRDVCICPAGKIYVSTSNTVPNQAIPEFIDKIVEIYAPPTTVPKNEFKELAQVAPNPAHSELAIILPPNATADYYVISDESGRAMLSGKFNKTNRISIRSLATGNYFVHLTNKGKPMYAAKFLKQ